MSRGDKVMYSVVGSLLVILALLWLDILVFKSWTWAGGINQTITEKSETTAVLSNNFTAVTMNGVRFVITQNKAETNVGVFAFGSQTKVLSEEKFLIYSVYANGELIGEYKVKVNPKE